ncbi:MAG: hypothetical protein NT030_08585, partial [Candidatus Saganbacteria bacterium]|nr:hypothetical protein [Candidatus Saganbacteria bacterium]
GLITFILFLAGIFVKSGNYFFSKLKDIDGDVILIGICGSIVALMVHGAAFGILAHNYTWIAFGLAIALTHIF